MYRPRLLGWQDANCYHVISRTTGRSFLFEPAEREMFALMLEKMARFCGVEVLTWCCLSNHFHLLVKISEPAAAELRDRLRSDPVAFLRHLGILYRRQAVKEMAAELTKLREQGHEAQADAMVDRYLLRIGDLSVFVKELKQRYSIWFNAKHRREGTLWSARFRSVLVENSARALRTVASYIDLNPVRAGIVPDPKDYRWCGYAQAMGGNRRARCGLREVLSEKGRNNDSREPAPSWRQAAEEYRVQLFGKGGSRDDGVGGVLRKGVDPEAMKRVISDGGKLPAAELFRLRVRHLTEGTALGCSEFLDELVKVRPQQVSERRKTAARKIRCLDDSEFNSLRDLGS